MTPPQTSVQAADRRDIGAIIPSDLDDAGLDVYAFRVYARIARRAGVRGECFESQTRMAEACGMSVRRLRDALRDLEGRGLIERIEDRRDTQTYVLLPLPAPAPPAGTPRHDMPPAPAPPAGTPRHHVPTEGVPSKGSPEGETHSAQPSLIDEGSPNPEPEPLPFEPFWDAFPRGRNGKGSKVNARRRWAKMTPDDRRAAMDALPNYVAAVEGGVWPAHAVTWLNQHRWDDWTEAPVPTSTNGVRSRQPVADWTGEDTGRF